MELETLKKDKPEASAGPLCPVFGQCGGCAHQDKTYAEELKIKENFLRTLYRENFEDSTVVESVIPSPDIYYYRSRLDIGFYRRRNGFQMGFTAVDSRNVIEVQDCHIARREIGEFLPELRRQAERLLPPKYRMATLVIKASGDGSLRWGGIGRNSCRLEEDNYLWAEINGKKIFYSLDTFFQSNTSILPLVFREIKKMGVLDQKTHWMDLYGGVGLFGIGLADEAAKVSIVEECAASNRIAAFNIRYHGLKKKVSLYHAKVEDELPRLLRQEAASVRSVAMIDPPRKGLAPSVVETLIEALNGRKRLAGLFYLSCSPISLVRDLKQLRAGGWQIKKILPFDFFPRTEHLETLAYLVPAD